MSEEIILSNRRCVIFPPKKETEKSKSSLLLINGSKETASFMEREKLLPADDFFAVVIISENWSEDFTPWPAKELNSKSPPFSGMADRYISWLKDELIPFLKGEYFKGRDVKVGMLGQSLSALFLLYLNIREPQLFSFAACISPSVWYENWMKYFSDSIKEQKIKSWYISCGLKEGTRCRDLRSLTQDCMKKTIELLRENGHEVTEYHDKGDHFDHLAMRLKDALSYISNEF